MLLFDENGNIMYRADRPHRQIINDRGWVSHDMEEVYANLIDGVRELMEQTGVDEKKDCCCWHQQSAGEIPPWPGREDGKPLAPAVGVACGRAKGIVEELERKDPGVEEKVRQITGAASVSHFPTAKMAWLLREEERPFIWERWTAILSTV